MKRGGGVAGMAARLQTATDALPPEFKRSAKVAEAQSQMQDLTQRLLGGAALAPEDQHLFSSLATLLESEAGGTVSKDRAERLADVLKDFHGILSSDDKDIDALLAKTQKMRDFIAGQFEMAHYLSHGIKRPPAGSLAANMVEQNWQLRRYLMEEMNRPEKGEQESKECLELNVRASRVDRRIYEAGTDDCAAMNVGREELYPLADGAVRSPSRGRAASGLRHLRARYCPCAR